LRRMQSMFAILIYDNVREKAAGRRNDLADLEYLVEIKRQTKRNKK